MTRRSCPGPRRTIVVKADRSGYVRALSARPVGHATMLLGAGRSRMDSPVDHAVGVILHKKVGDAVDRGEPLFTLLVNDEARLPEAEALIRDAYTIAERAGRRRAADRGGCPWSIVLVRGPLYAEARTEQVRRRCEDEGPNNGQADNGQRTHGQ